MTEPGRVLILWNQVEDDVYEHLRAEEPRSLPWDPGKLVETMATANEELALMLDALRAAGHTAAVVNVRDQLSALLGSIAEHRPDVVFNLVEFFGDDFAH